MLTERARPCLPRGAAARRDARLLTERLLRAEAGAAETLRRIAGNKEGEHCLSSRRSPGLPYCLTHELSNSVRVACNLRGAYLPTPQGGEAGTQRVAPRCGEGSHDLELACLTVCDRVRPAEARLRCQNPVGTVREAGVGAESTIPHCPQTRRIKTIALAGGCWERKGRATWQGRRPAQAPLRSGGSPEPTQGVQGCPAVPAV